MRVVSTHADIRALRKSYGTASVAFVPTMGALHDGHAALVRFAQQYAPHTIVSIFVNPTQFGPQEDFEKYPRTLDADVTFLETLGVSAVYCPDFSEMYPTGLSDATRIYVPQLGTYYCGKSRPQFFEGVCSVVLRFFLAICPDYAVFGEKDFQQFYIVSKMATDLKLPIGLLCAPVVREPDGLAMSSRNRYLSATERQSAPLIYRTLTDIMAHLKHTKNPAELCETAKATLHAHGIVTDYLVHIDSRTLEEITEFSPYSRLLFAGYLGTTRLVDTVQLENPAPPSAISTPFSLIL